MHLILNKILPSKLLHAKWLNTLSFMENAGARKISACESENSVDIIQLKHAAEEHRHAYYLKKQLFKLDIKGFRYYDRNDLLAPVQTRQYLNKLDVFCCRYLQQHYALSSGALKYAAYLFVTYLIEVRADYIYPVYQEVLTQHQSKVMVRSIIVEEEGHLEEMMTQLNEFDKNWQLHTDELLRIENILFEEWFSAITKEVLSDERDRAKLV